MVSVLDNETREHGSTPGLAPIFSVFFLFLFSDLMLNYFILVKQNIIKALRVLVGTAALKRSNREVAS